MTQGISSTCYFTLPMLTEPISPMWWAWVWVSSRSWWWTGKPGMVQSMGSQRVGHDWATELNWYIHIYYIYFLSVEPFLHLQIKWLRKEQLGKKENAGLLWKTTFTAVTVLNYGHVHTHAHTHTHTHTHTHAQTMRSNTPADRATEKH